MPRAQSTKRRRQLRPEWRRLLKLLDRYRFDPAKATLAWWIAAINVTVVLLVVGGISISAIGLLRDLADQQGQARAQLAGALAREDVRRYGEDALKSARGLVATPTFQRIRLQGRAAVEPFLRRSCTVEPIKACALFDGTNQVAAVGTPLPWSDLIAAASEQGERFIADPEGTIPPLLGAFEAAGTDARLYVVRFMDEQMAQSLAERVGTQVRLLKYGEFTKAKEDLFTRLHSAGLSDGRSAVMRIDELNIYAASYPIFATSGEAIALLESRVSSSEIDALVGDLVTRLLITAIVLAALALLAGVLLGQQVAGPVSALTEASVRLGQGDFSTSIPVGGTAEVVKLAGTMEDMRHNLVDLTSTLRRSEAEAQAVLSGIVEGVYAVDRDRVIRYLNPQAARLLGMRAEDAIGRFCGDVLKPCVDRGVRPCEANCPILHARMEGSAQATEQLELLGGNRRTTVITSAAPAEGLQVQVIRDETDLEAVRRARDSVLANISHEFRTPLAAQLASIELLREGLDTVTREEQRELVLSLERGTLRLTRLIDNLLESVRIESGQLSIRQQSVSLAEVIEDAQALIGALLVQRRQILDVSFPEDLPQIEGDSPRLTQVFVNLLANASKFAPEGSTVQVGARLAATHVIAWVEDEGPGLPFMENNSIFERFYRGPEQEPEPGGLGLGLWIVKSIIDRHGGTVAARRTRQGHTRFEVSLPRRTIDT